MSDDTIIRLIIEYELLLNCMNNFLDNGIGGIHIMVRLQATTVADGWLDPGSGLTKEYKIGVCCFSANHAALSSKNDDRTAQNRDSVSSLLCLLAFLAI